MDCLVVNPILLSPLVVSPAPSDPNSLSVSFLTCEMEMILVVCISQRSVARLEITHGKRSAQRQVEWPGNCEPGTGGSRRLSAEM